MERLIRASETSCLRASRTLGMNQVVHNLEIIWHQLLFLSDFILLFKSFINQVNYLPMVNPSFPWQGAAT